MIQKNGQNSTYKICPQNMKPDKVIYYYSIQNMAIGQKMQDRLYRQVKCEVGKYKKNPLKLLVLQQLN